MWLTRFLTSAVGQKVVMSLTGLFLIIFLVVHLAGNLQLLIPDEGVKFNQYGYFMTSNPVIKATSYILYALILVHAIQGIALWIKNRAARGNTRYAVKTASPDTNVAARNMAWLGIIIFVFLLVHLYQFWFQMKIGALEMVRYDGYDYDVKNLYAPVKAAFTNIWFVIFYVFSMAVIGMHLWHGFQSSFQTLGLNHKRYTPFIKGVGMIYSIVIPLAFAIIPLYFFFTN